MLGIFSSSFDILGLDVGASAIKLVLGKKTKKNFRVEKLAILPLPPRMIDERGIVNQGVVVEAIRSCLSSISTKKLKVATGFGGLGVLTKRITIPRVPKKEIADQIRWEAEQVFPADIDGIITEYVLLGEGDQVPGAPAGTKGWDVLLIGVRKEEASLLRSSIVEAGADLRLMDLQALATTDFLDSLLGLEKIPPSEATAYVDVGAATTRFWVKSGGGRLLYLREFSRAGVAFTEAIAHSLGLSFEDAEALKIQDGSPIPEAALDSLQMALKNWKQDLQQSEDLYMTQESSLKTQITRYVFFGGGTLTPYFFENLAEDRFSARMVSFQPGQMISADSKTVDPVVLSSWATRLLTAASLCGRRLK